jgi:hypothetical protein
VAHRITFKEIDRGNLLAAIRAAHQEKYVSYEAGSFEVTYNPASANL